MAFPATTIWAQHRAFMCGMRLASIRRCPGVGGVVLGTPMFDKATLRLSGGRTLVVSRQGNGFYVQKVTLDGVPYSSSWLSMDKLHSGTTQLRFTNDVQPNKERGNHVADRPPSFR